MKMISRSYENLEVTAKFSANEVGELISIVREFISQNPDDHCYNAKEILKNLINELEF